MDTTEVFTLVNFRTIYYILTFIIYLIDRCTTYEQHVTQNMLYYFSLSLSFTVLPLLSVHVVMILNHENNISLFLILHYNLVSPFYSAGSHIYTVTSIEIGKKYIFIKSKYTLQSNKAPFNITSYLIDVCEIQINIYLTHHYFLLYIFSIPIPECLAYIMAYYIMPLIDQYRPHTRIESFSHAIFISIYNVLYKKKSILYLSHIISVLTCITCILIALSEMKLIACWIIYTKYALSYIIQLMHSIAHSVIMTALRFIIIYIVALVTYIINALLYQFHNSPFFSLQYCMHLYIHESYLSNIYGIFQNTNYVNDFVYKWIQLYLCNIYMVKVDIYIKYVLRACVYVKCVCGKLHVIVNQAYVDITKIIYSEIHKNVFKTHFSKNMKKSSAKRFFTLNQQLIIFFDKIIHIVCYYYN